MLFENALQPITFFVTKIFFAETLNLHKFNRNVEVALTYQYCAKLINVLSHTLKYMEL